MFLTPNTGVAPEPLGDDVQNCIKKRVAYRVNGKVFLNKDVIPDLSPAQLAVLEAHEYLYEFSMHNNSSQVRELLSHMLKNPKESSVTKLMFSSLRPITKTSKYNFKNYSSIPRNSTLHQRCKKLGWHSLKDGVVLKFFPGTSYKFYKVKYRCVKF